jgi:hypothetical protein
VDPALIYFGMLGFCLVVLVLGWIHKRPATRECPLCESRVELGKIRCQICGYRFTTARY